MTALNFHGCDCTQNDVVLTQYFTYFNVLLKSNPPSSLDNGMTIPKCTVVHVYIYIHTHTHTHTHTGCPRRNVPDFGRMFLMLKYTDITQNTCIRSWTVTEIMARKFETLTAVTHLLITKYILKLAGICGFCNVNICT